MDGTTDSLMVLGLCTLSGFRLSVQRKIEQHTVQFACICKHSETGPIEEDTIQAIPSILYAPLVSEQFHSTVLVEVEIAQLRRVNKKNKSVRLGITWQLE